MNAITDPLAAWNQLRWTQLNQLEALRHRLRRIFGPTLVHWPEGQENGAHCIPLVDIREDLQEYLIEAELPQVKQRDVKLNVESGTLTITADRKFKKNSKKHHRAERTDGSFVHSFSLPDDATPPEVTAEFNEGVLKVHLAKKEKARPQQVEVEATAYDLIPDYGDCSSRWGINE